MLNKITPILVAGAVSAVAGHPVATVTSSDEFTLSGVHIAATAVSSWPLTIGDEIKDFAAPAVIRFADNTQVAVAKGSSVKLEMEDGRMVVRLTNGSMTYRSGNNPQIRVFALDKELDKSQGGVAIKGQNVSVSAQNGAPPIRPELPREKPPGRSQGE